MTHRIVHVAGTMGSGKITLIRAFMAQHSSMPMHAAGKAGRPSGYQVKLPTSILLVMGPYEPDLQTSGCDANKDTAWNYDAILQAFVEGHSVVYEGLFMMNHTRGLALARAVGVESMVVLRLTTPIEVCREGVRARRLAQGNDEALPPRFEDGLRGNDVRARNYAYKMKCLGVLVHPVTRENALAKLSEVLS